MSDDQNDMIQKAVIDQVQKIVDRAQSQLEQIKCPQHGKALKKLDFLKDTGRFKIETCCPEGEALVNSAIEKLT